MNSNILTAPNDIAQRSTNEKPRGVTTFFQRYGLLLLLLLLVSSVAVAGSQGAEFDQMYQMVRGWIEGTMGKLFAVAAFAVGMGIGIVKQSIMALVVGIGMAVVCAYAPAILDAIFTFSI